MHVQLAFDTEDSRNVVLKFFDDQTQWERESHIIAMLNKLGDIPPHPKAGA